MRIGVLLGLLIIAYCIDPVRFDDWADVSFFLGSSFAMCLVLDILEVREKVMRVKKSKKNCAND